MHRRTWLLLPAGVSLLAGLDAALLLLEVPAPVDAAHLPTAHGILMVLGFLGTLISLERAVALRSPWAYAAPALLGAGGVMLAAGPRLLGQALLIDGLVAFLAIAVLLEGRQGDGATAVEVLAVSHALAAAILWTRLEVSALLPLLVGFVVWTIAAERVELARPVGGPMASQVRAATASQPQAASIAAAEKRGSPRDRIVCRATS